MRSSMYAQAALVLMAVVSTATLAEEVAIRPEWKVGDHITLRVTKSDSDHLDANKQPLRNILIVDLEIIERHDSGGLLRLTLRDKDPAPLNAIQPRKRAQNELLCRGHRAEVEFDADCNLIGLRNLEELRTHFLKVVEADMEVQGAIRGMTREETASTEAFLREQLSSDAMVLNASLANLAMYFRPFGFVLSSTAATEFREEPVSELLPGLPGCTSTFRIARTYGSTDVVEIRMTREFDEKPSAPWLKEVMRKVTSQPAESMPEPPVPKISESARYRYDTRSGWIIRGELTQTLVIDGQRSTIRFLWERVPETRSDVQTQPATMPATRPQSQPSSNEAR